MFLAILSWMTPLAIMWFWSARRQSEQLHNRYAVKQTSSYLQYARWTLNDWLGILSERIISVQIVTWESSRPPCVRLNNKVWQDFYESRSSPWNLLITFLMTFYTVGCRCGQMSFHLPIFLDDSADWGSYIEWQRSDLQRWRWPLHLKTDKTKDLIIDL